MFGRGTFSVQRSAYGVKRIMKRLLFLTLNAEALTGGEIYVTNW